MNNPAVIRSLRGMVRELEKRTRELEKLRRNPGGSMDEFVDRQMLVLARLSSINIRVAHLQTRIREREYVAKMRQAVSPLSASRRQAMQKAMRVISRRIAAARTFKAAIKLATAISDAATSAQDASRRG